MKNRSSIYKFLIQFSALGVVVAVGLLSIIGTGSNSYTQTTLSCIGKSQHVRTGSRVILDGRCSDFTEAAPDTAYLDFIWQLTSKPADSSSVLTDFTMMSSFIADVDGEYVATLKTSTGANQESITTRITAYTGNARPVAEAGAYQEVSVGDTVQLNGTATDADDNSLSYNWSFQPGSASATLSSTTSATTTFVADSDTDYMLDLVVNDGAVDSASNTVIIRSKNSDFSLPVAVAGTDQFVNIGSQVQLNGQNSYSAYGNPLSYNWRMLYRPTGSSTQLTDKTGMQPSFIADVAGAYLIRLRVNDGFRDSSRSLDDIYEDRVVVIASNNQLPIADGGVDQSVNTGVTVNLNGNGSSDPEMQTLTYVWTLIKQPTGSTAALSSLDTQTTQLTPDRDGNYLVRLVVNDGTDDSYPDIVRVTTSSLGGGATQLTLTPDNLPYTPSMMEDATWIQIDTDDSDTIRVTSQSDLIPGNFETAFTAFPTGMVATESMFGADPDWTIVSPANLTIDDSTTPTFIIRRTSDGMYYQVTLDFTTLTNNVRIDALQAWHCGTDSGYCP